MENPRELTENQLISVLFSKLAASFLDKLEERMRTETSTPEGLKRVGLNVRTMMGLRKIYGVATLAKLASVDRAQLGKFLDGKNRISKRAFMAIAQVLEVHPNLLLGENLLKEIEEKVLNPAFKD